MTDFDLSRLPKGELGRQALLEYVLSSDDRLERHFLEVKSEVDLNLKNARAKVAKFILGAANRDPTQASKRFDGHALMVLGVGGGEAKGLPGFEALDLARDVQKFVGAAGPGWDFERIPVADGRDVIVIVVDPPTGEMFTCFADGEGLENGSTYVRADGSTRRATGDEIRQMIKRSTGVSNPVEVDVEVVGTVMVYDVDPDPIIAAAEREADGMLAESRPDRRLTTGVRISGLRFGERRSPNEFAAEVEAWRQSIRDAPYSGLVDVAAHVLDGVQVRVINRARTFLRDVRIELELDGPVTAVEWVEPYEEGEFAGLLIGRPKRWGSESYYIPNFSQVASSFPTGFDGVVQIEQENPASLVLTMKDLRPMQTVLTADDEVVLLICPAVSDVAEVTGRWRLTAAGVHDVFEGQFSIPTETREIDAAEAV